jgi:hypothetical protein
LSRNDEFLDALWYLNRNAMYDDNVRRGMYEQAQQQGPAEQRAKQQAQREQMSGAQPQSASPKNRVPAQEPVDCVFMKSFSEWVYGETLSEKPTIVHHENIWIPMNISELTTLRIGPEVIR